MSQGNNYMRMCLTSKYPEAIEFKLPYESFIEIKCRIALNLDKTFGKHYSKFMKRIGIEDFENFSRLYGIMLCDTLNFNDDQLNVNAFLWNDESYGEVPYNVCKTIYNLIKDTYYDDLQLRFSDESNHDWEEFKKLLK